MKIKLLTTTYQNELISREEEEIFAVADSDSRELNVLNIYPEIKYQKMLGFGGAITESVGTILNQIPKELANEVMDLYFGDQGIGYRFVRSHLDSCDFALGNYSAVEDGEDANLTTFSIGRDETNIIPHIKAAYSKARSQLSVMLSPWSPPAFMKTNQSKNGGGKLKKEYYELWANYICKYIKEYQKQGIMVDMITIQNEPNAVQTWDSCTYTSDEEREFLQYFLYPELKRQGLVDIKVFIWDHNKERLYERARDIITDETDKMVDGLAFHWYSGDHFDALKLVREQYPNKLMVFTEGCIEYSRLDKSAQLQNAQMYGHDIIGNLNNGMNLFFDWNIVLNEEGGPNHVGNYCEAPIICDIKNQKLIKKLSFYYIEHFSRFIKSGAVRIATTIFSDNIEVTAFQNTDKSITIVMLNRTKKDIEVFTRIEGKMFKVLSKKQSISTIVLEQ